MEDYIFDVFLSYRHDYPVGPWVTKYFYDMFKGWLSEELGGREVNVFFDKRELEPGEKWPDSLRAAIKTSRVLVAVCSPGYFRSKWCLSEWNSFQAREKLLGRNSLRVPIRHNDGQHFPEDAKNIQMMDFSRCVGVMPAFVNDQRALELEDKIKELAASVAKAVNSAPPFQPDWPIVEADSIIIPARGMLRL
jgi:hypothetical protein